MVSTLALASAGAASSYGWPFKPFNKQHPIRGFFGDPRTVYENGVLAGGFDGPGFFSFHQGVDISAPDGTPIYPVVSGIAHYLGAATLNVDTGKYQGTSASSSTSTSSRSWARASRSSQRTRCSAMCRRLSVTCT